MNQIINFQARVKPAMPVATKHRRALQPFTRDDGQVESAEVHAGTALIPRGDCQAIISELERALILCPAEAALVFAKKLIGCYRIKDVVDVGIYVGTMAEKFQKFPADIGARIVDTVTDTLKFPPVPADVMEVGRVFLQEREAALRAARKHEAERQRRADKICEAEKLKIDQAGRESALEEAYARAGLDWPGPEGASWVKVAAAGMVN